MPSMDTPGGCIDEISITNLKIFKLEDEARDESIEPERMVAVKRNIDALNLQRNRLIARIDELILSRELAPRPNVKLYGKQVATTVLAPSIKLPEGMNESTFEKKVNAAIEQAMSKARKTARP